MGPTNRLRVARSCLRHRSVVTVLHALCCAPWCSTHAAEDNRRATLQHDAAYCAARCTVWPLWYARRDTRSQETTTDAASEVAEEADDGEERVEDTHTLPTAASKPHRGKGKMGKVRGPVPAQMWQGEPSLCADVARCHRPKVIRITRTHHWLITRLRTVPEGQRCHVSPRLVRVGMPR